MKRALFCILLAFFVCNPSFSMTSSSFYLSGAQPENVWNDSGAESRARIVASTVKISEDVTVKNINDYETSFEDVTSGSGAVIYQTIEKTYVITAHHVCTPALPVGMVLMGGVYKVTENRKFVITRKLKKIPAEVVYEDEKNDVCVMRVKSVVGKPSKIASFYPPETGRILSSGAPAGVWRGTANMVEGFYMGIVKERICVQFSCYKNFIQFSMPIVGGMSGSGIYYRGQLIGLITIGRNGYEHIGWGPGIAPLKEAYDAVKEIENGN